MLCGWMTAGAQNDEQDIWKQVDLKGLDYEKPRNYCQRLCVFYRYYDDGMTYTEDREKKLYRIYEGICELDIRYKKDYDDGATVMVGRNLVHPERDGEFVDFYELKPYTFLEKARRDPKHFSIESQGDTTRVYHEDKLAGLAVRDTLNRELHISYNALAPDTALSINLFIIKARLTHVDADAVYRIDDAEIDYVPQGQLKRIVFDGDITLTVGMGGKSVREEFHERTELYVDSVAYLTQDEYKADRKLSLEERRKRSGYQLADIDRLKQKLGVPPLSAATKARIEEQRDWEDAFEQWQKTSK